MSVSDLEARLDALEKRHRLLQDFATRGLWNGIDRLYARTPAASHARCLACDWSGATTDFGTRIDQCMFAGGRLERLECPRCTCVFGPLSVLDAEPEWISSDYRLLYADYSEADSTGQEIRCFEALNPSRSGLYLNWGAGAWSRSVEVLRARGYDVWGFEPNAEQTKDCVVSNRAEVSARFDGVFSNNVLEHLTAPSTQFLDFHSVLKPGGRMAHATPCYEWSYAFTRFHVFFPLQNSIERLAERTGFKVTSRIDEGEFRLRTFEITEPPRG